MNERVVEIHSAAEIAGRVEALAVEISEAFQRRDPLVLAVVEDSFVFLADLLRALAPKTPLRTNFLRYDQRDLGGLQDLSFTTSTDVRGRDILLVEGVLETGVPQEYIIRQLEGRGAARVRLCVLVDKPDARRTSIEPDWRAFETREQYVVGYGLGQDERWRELSYLATLARD